MMFIASFPFRLTRNTATVPVGRAGHENGGGAVPVAPVTDQVDAAPPAPRQRPRRRSAARRRPVLRWSRFTHTTGPVRCHRAAQVSRRTAFGTDWKNISGRNPRAGVHRSSDADRAGDVAAGRCPSRWR